MMLYGAAVPPEQNTVCKYGFSGPIFVKQLGCVSGPAVQNSYFQ